MEGTKNIFLSTSRSQFVAIGLANILKIGQRITFLRPKWILNRDFALAGEIIHDHKFSFYAILDLHTMIWSHVSILWHFMMILKDYDRILWFSKFCGKIITSLTWFFVQKLLIQNCFLVELFKLSTDFQNFAAHFRKIKRRILQRKYFAYSWIK